MYVAFCPQVLAEFWFAAPDGSPAGTGRFEDPWDLRTALVAPTIAPGDIVFLRDGTYVHPDPQPPISQFYLFQSRLYGEPGNPIIVRSYPGEWARIDGRDSDSRPILLVRGEYTRYEQFEIVSSHPDRTATEFGNSPPDIVRGVGLQTHAGDGQGDSGPGLEFVHLVVHDARAGIVTQKGARGVLIYGNIVNYCGWNALTETNGHGIYLRNPTDYGTKFAKENIVFSQFAYGIHGFSSAEEPGAPWAENLWVDGNISFNNGILSRGSGMANRFAANFILQHGCGGCVATHPVLIDNASWYSALPLLHAGTYPACGTLGISSDLVVAGNYLVGSGVVQQGERAALHVSVGQTGATSVVNNTLLGEVTGSTLDPNDGNVLFVNGALPTSNHVIVRPSAYQAGRANIVVYAWDAANRIIHLTENDLAGAISPGDLYEIYDVQTTPLGEAVASPGLAVWRGTLTGAGLFLDLDDVDVNAVIPPIHEATDTVQTPPHTAPLFYVFVLMRPTDFDGDGSPDRVDPNPIEVGGLVDGDFDIDGDVDVSDFAVFGQCFGGTNRPPAESCPPTVNADFDDDNDVDVTDFAIFAQNFTGSR